MSLPPLRDWQAGDSNRDRAHFQQAVDALRELDRREGRRGDWVPTREKILAKLVATPAGEAALTDARYWVQEQLVEGARFRGALTLSEDTTKKAFGGLAPNIHVATNIAEWSSTGGTHALMDGMIVRLEEWTDRGTINRQHYLFNRPPAGVLVKVTSNASGGGQYNGTVYGGTPSPDGAGNLALPEGLTAGASCLVVNQDEDGQATHWITADSYAEGAPFGMSAEATPRPVVLIPRGQYRTASPSTIGSAAEGSEAAEATTWARATSDAPLELYASTRVAYYDAGNETLYTYIRKLTFAADGRLHSVGAETRVTVDVPAECVP